MSRYYITSTILLVLLLVSLSLDGKLAIPSWWYIMLIVIYLAITLSGVYILSFSYFFPVELGGSGDSGSLTFDMDDNASNVTAILDILKGAGVSATFFCTGKAVSRHPGVIQDIFNEGHIIGSSGYWKGKMFSLKSSTMIGRELFDTEAAIHGMTGRRLRFFRPPFGISSPMLAKAIARKNYKVIGWKIDFSAENNPENVSQRISGALIDGAILRFDTGNPEVIGILDSVIRHLFDKKIKLVRLDELVKEKAYA